MIKESAIQRSLLAILVATLLAACQGLPQAANNGVQFSTDFPQGRLDVVSSLGNGVWRVHSAPENLPINPSPWYAFKVQSAQPQSIEVVFNFGEFDYRYPARVQRADGNWELAPTNCRRVQQDASCVRLQVGPEPLRVAAQELISGGLINDWLTQVAEQLGRETERIGRSVGGRDLRGLRFGAAAPAPQVWIIGRQHPPEVSGSLGLMAFVDALAADTELAREFRRQFGVRLAPLVNPDGVHAGNWRHNLNGLDLNRDWGPFTQSETRSLARWLKTGGEPVFAIDFHSTWRDVVYLVEDPAANPPIHPAVTRWIDGVSELLEGDLEVQAYAAGSAVFKNWVYREYQAPAITFEFADDTDRERLKEVSAAAAMQLMAQLMDRDATSG